MNEGEKENEPNWLWLCPRLFAVLTRSQCHIYFSQSLCGDHDAAASFSWCSTVECSETFWGSNLSVGSLFLLVFSLRSFITQSSSLEIYHLPASLVFVPPVAIPFRKRTTFRVRLGGQCAALLPLPSQFQVFPPPNPELTSKPSYW
jgi:hypothetical protein